MRSSWLLGLLALAAPVWAEWGLLDQPQTFPWSVGLAPSALEGPPSTQDALRFRVSELWLNTHRQFGEGASMAQLVDMEAWSTTASALWSPRPGWELRGQGQFLTTGPGILDPALNAFHSALGLPNQGREGLPSNQVRNYIEGVLDRRHPQSGLTQSSVLSRWISGPWSSFVWVKPPVAARSGWGWSHRWGSGAGFGWGDRWPLGAGYQLRTGAVGALVWVQEDDSLGPTSPWSYQVGGYALVEASWGPRLVGQGVWTKVPRVGEGYLPQGAGLLTVGVQWPLDEHWAFELALAEEFLTWATLEVGFQSAVVWKP